jgi:tetratricopeptide (TPR) repeat protein
LPAARKYASVAPSSAHALHMPSHIFTRLGLWQEDISSNLASVAAAQCYAEQAGIKGHWDEELHGLDYLMYSYLQQGNNTIAKRQWAYLNTISTVEPVSFKVAYAFAAIPARYVLENKQWQEASQLQSHSPTFPWEKFPWQKAILHFTRLLGAAHIGNQVGAEAERQELNRLEALLTQQKDAYKANQVHIQLTAGTAWIRLQEGKAAEALALMSRAAAMEDSTEKHPVTPGEVLPAKELLADMYLQLRRPTDALIAYESSLQQHPNRFNSLYGAGRAAEQAGNPDKARRYYQQLLAIVAPRSARPEVAVAQRFLEKQSLKTSLAGISSAKAKEPAVVNRRLL